MDDTRLEEKLRFGDWTLERRSGELSRQGATHSLPDKVQTLLDCFLANPGRLLSRDELKATLWPDGVHVDFDNNLNTLLARLREVLGDSGRDPRYIETVPRRGYRWIGPPVKRGFQRPILRRRVLWWTAAALLAAVAATAWWFRPPSSATLRVAVAPFEIVAGSQLQYLARGLTWDLVTELANWNPARLEVIGRSASRGDSPLPDPGRVDYVVRGALQGDSAGPLRINVHLVRTSDDVTIWAAEFDRWETDAMRLQRQIAGHVTSALGLRLARLVPEEAAIDPAAWAALLRARYLLDNAASPNQQSATLQRAAAEANTALELEPEAVSVLLLAADVASARAPSDPAQLETAHRYLARALDLAPDHPETLLRRANYRFNLHWDFEGAARDFERALQLAPNDASFHGAYAFFLSSRSRHDQAVSHLRRALELEPVSAAVSGDLAWIYFQARRYREAIEQARLTLHLQPDHKAALQTILLAQSRLGRRSEALQTARSVLELSQVPEDTIRRVIESGSLKEVWKLALDKLQRTAADSHVHPASFALIYGLMEDPDRTLRSLEAAYEEPYCGYLPSIGVDPRMDIARDSDRFEALLTKIQHSPRPDSPLARMLARATPTP